MAQSSAPSSLREYQVTDFRRGLDVKTSPLTLALSRGQNALRKADNMVYTSAGAATKRLDQQTLTNSSVGANVAVTGGWQFIHSNGNRYVLFGTDDGKVYKLNTNGTTTLLASGFTLGTRWYFTTYNDKAIICNRADVPKKWDGTTFGTLGGSPPATGGPVAVHGSRVFFADATNTSMLTGSALDDEEDYTSVNDAFAVNVSTNDGAHLVNLIPSIQDLVVIKSSRPYRLSGTSPTTFTIGNVVPTTGSVGSVSFQGACFALNDVWYSAPVGVITLSPVFYQFGALKESLASDLLDSYWNPNGTDPPPISLENLPACCMIYDGQQKQILTAVDSDGDGKNDLLLVYSFRTTGWSVWPDQGIASMWTVKNAVTGVNETYVGTYDGNVRVLNRPVSTNAIDGHARHLSALNAPGVIKSPRYLMLYLSEEGGYTVSVDTKFDFGAAGGQTYSVSLLGNSHLLGVNWVLGVDPLGAQAQLVKRVDLSGIGEFLEIGVRNQNAGEPFTWFGYQCFWRFRRQIRAA